MQYAHAQLPYGRLLHAALQQLAHLQMHHLTHEHLLRNMSQNVPGSYSRTFHCHMRIVVVCMSGQQMLAFVQLAIGLPS